MEATAIPNTKATRSDATVGIASHCLKLAIFIFGLFANVQPGAAKAPTDKWERAIETYLGLAFPNNTIKSLIKYAGPVPIPTEVSCSIPIGNICNDMNSYLSKAIETNVNVRFAFVPAPLLRIEFFDHVNQEAILESAQRDFAGEFIDVTDHDCMGFLIRKGDSILQAKIIVSSEQPELKLRSCLTFQLGQVLGIGLDGAGFGPFWSSNPQQATDETVWRLRELYGLLEYIQLCPDLLPGMTEEQVRAQLESETGCMSKLGGIR